MAKLTESYLRKLIKQVMRENMGSENPDDVEHAVEQWYMAGDATVEEIAAEFGVSAAAMHRSIDEDERKRAAEDQGDYEDPYDLLESRRKRTAPKRK